VRKQLLIALALLTLVCLVPGAATAQLPGGIKVPKIPKREKAQPAPTPGEYEVRVLRHGRLARTIKFTVGPDGQLVNNGHGAGIGMPWVNFVPVAIHGDQDGTWDKNAWKTEAFYGSPLNSFAPAP